IGEDPVRVAQVGADGCGQVRVVCQQRLGVALHDGVAVDVDHARCGDTGAGDLMYRALGGQPGSDVDELVDAGFGAGVHGTAHERPVGQSHRHEFGDGLHGRAGGVAVARVVV